MDPFYETQETHNLIGVGSIFLEVLFSDVILDYSTPVISQQGEVAGRLQVRNENVVKLIRTFIFGLNSNFCVHSLFSLFLF